MNKQKYIKDWHELSTATSDTHVLEIDINNCNGWIHPKNDIEFRSFEGHHYLSTHTFYGGGFSEESTELLQSCGFNVTLANWDED